MAAGLGAAVLLAVAIGWARVALRRRRLYRQWPRPRRFERNLVVIGAGAAGLVAAYLASALRARVTLIEAGQMGGDCLNTGCVPSKALITTTRLLARIAQADRYGIGQASARADFATVKARVREVIAGIAPHDSQARYTGLGVEVIPGRARLLTPWQVAIATADGERLMSARHIILATGAQPVVPAIAGIERVHHVTSETVWSLESLPARLLVLGGGPIGCELAQAFARLGSQVTLVQRGPRLLPKEDEDVVVPLDEALQADGVSVLTASESMRCEREADGEQRLIIRREGNEQALVFDVLLCATGRKANTQGLGLEALGIALNRDGTVQTDRFLRTRYPNILACGDVAGPYQFTHTAAHQAGYATLNALFSGLRRFRVDNGVIPWVTYTDPEVARVGLSEAEATEQGIAVEVTRYPFSELDRAIIDNATAGFIKVLTPVGRDRILGVSIVGEHAGELLAEFVLAMQHGIGLNRILATVHTYPGWSEAVRNSAGTWRRAHASPGLLRLLARFHAWRR
jgi:pyruvate/2-oxoglutarate dehydrogenase complex dihydrolipoamide dehydrogenase (E3) component